MTDLIQRAREKWCEEQPPETGFIYEASCPPEVVAALLTALECPTAENQAWAIAAIERELGQ